MRIVIYISLAIFAAMSIWQIIFDEIKHTESSTDGQYSFSDLCHTWYFFVANFFQAFATAFFIWIGLRVRKTVGEYNRHTKAIMSSESQNEESENQQAVMEIEIRLKAVRNMSIIIWTISLTVAYMTIYTIVYSFFSDSECYVQEVVWVRSLSTFLERSIQYIWWMYPILWLFWPKDIRCVRCCKSRKRITSSMLNSDA